MKRAFNKKERLALAVLMFIIILNFVVIVWNMN
jgi:hypothetical protein